MYQSEFVTDKDIFIMIGTFFTSFLVAVITAFVTAKLAFRRFYSEKQWERTAEAYSKLFIALHKIKDHTQHAILEEKIDESRFTKEMNADRDQLMKQLSKSMRRGQAQLRLHLDIGTFLISRKAVTLLDAFLVKLDEGVEEGRESRGGNYMKYLSHRLSSTEDCLIRLRQEAVKDTGRVWR